MCAIFSCAVHGQATKPTEYQVEAAYLYNFGKFVRWPSPRRGRSDNFGLCVLGRDPFGSGLDAIVSGEVVDDRKVVVHRLTSAEQAGLCSIVFISSSEEFRLKAELSVLDRLAVLTVSDMPRFVERGGMIQFRREGDRIRFEVNLAPADRAGLSLSSELLKVAVRVTNGPPGS